MKCRGKIIKKVFGKGSKSEHLAVMLVTDKREYRLRRKGGNPFFDEELEKLVGKSVRCEGLVHGQTFILSSWDELAENESTSSD